MAEHSTTIGLDIGDKYCDLCVLDNDSGEVLEQSRVRTTSAALKHYFGKAKPSRVVMEVGGQSGWISRLVVEAGHEALVADSRRVRNLAGGQDKDDKLDAEFLARVGRMDPKLLKPVVHRSEHTQAALAQIRARDNLVEARTQLINHVRGVVKSLGRRLPPCAAYRFDTLPLPQCLEEPLGPMMAAIKALNEQIRSYDRMIEQTAEQDYPQTTLLRQVSGVGAVTALTYVLVIEDPTRFEKSRVVGSYLGLCPRRWQSGDSDPELRISKAGDRLLRRLLVNCAHYIMGPFGPDSDLRRWGLAYSARGGKNAKKRAIVGVARRLAVLLHALWTNGQTYEPLRNSSESRINLAVTG